MSEKHDDIRALRVMVEELRAEPPPELPWDTIEQRLLAQITRESATRRARAEGSPIARVLGFAAAAAVIALGIGGAVGAADLPRPAAAHTRRVEAAHVALAPGEAGARGDRDLRALEVGDVIEAGAAPITFAREGLVAWTLAPGSALRVRSMGAARSGVGHTVALERGSIRAEVTPRDAAEGLVEAFAVEAMGTRVAVHGTAFSVTLVDGRAVVDVEHGAVAIGPIGHVGTTTGHLLVGPTRASFSLDGARSARLLPRAAPAPAPIAAALPDPAHDHAPGEVAAPPEREPDAPPAAAPHAVPVSARAPEPASPAIAPPVPEPSVAALPAPAAPPPLTVATVRAHLLQCFRTAYEPGSSSVQISVSSTLRLALNPDGSVRSARFEPPLKPEMVACTGSIMGGRFADAGAAVDVPVTYRP